MNEGDGGNDDERPLREEVGRLSLEHIVRRIHMEQPVKSL